MRPRAALVPESQLPEAARRRRTGTKKWTTLGIDLVPPPTAIVADALTRITRPVVMESSMRPPGRTVLAVAPDPLSRRIAPRVRRS